MYAVFMVELWRTLHFPSFCIFFNPNTRYYDNILRGLHPLFGESEPDQAVRDNAAGAVARMIMVHPESIPLNQVIDCFICIACSCSIKYEFINL